MHGCRTCLSRYDLSPLFSEQGVVKFSSDELLLVTGVKIEPNDGLSQLACQTCIKQISKTLALREMSSKVDRKLRSMMLKYGTVMKTEQNYNTLQNLIDPFSNEDILFCKDIKQESTKAFCPSDLDHNNDNNSSLIEHTEINTSPQSYKNDRNKITINDFEISDRNDSDVDDSNDDFDTKDTIPIIEINIESIDNNVNYSRDNILTDYNDSLQQKNDTNAFTSNVFEPDISLTTQSEMPKVIVKDSTKDTRKTSSKVKDTKQKKCLTRKYKITQVESKFDLTRGQLCQLQIENAISKKELDEVFEENDSGTVTNNWDAYFKNIITEKEFNKVFGDISSGKNTDKSRTINMKPHPTNGPFQCQICDIKLSTFHKWKYHTIRHTEPRFPCEQCDKKFYSRSVLVYHQQSMHGKEKRLSCSVCGYKAVHGYILRIHQLQHTGERPFVCNECGASFRSRTGIANHLQIHFGVENIQCEMCSRMFKSRTRLRGHQMKTHLMTYTYHCYMCPRTFKTPGATKKHLLKFHGVPRKEQRVIKFVKTKRTDNVHSA